MCFVPMLHISYASEEEGLSSCYGLYQDHRVVPKNIHVSGEEDTNSSGHGLYQGC